MILQVMYQKIFFILLPILACVVVYRLFFYKSACYTYPLIKEFAQHRLTQKSHHKIIFFLLRLALLLGLIFLIARPVWVDERSAINVDGVDIVLAIDVSGSMSLFDDLSDRRSRIEVARQEAVRFIEKRIDDPIGLVIFGQEVISRCPLTLDKGVLKELVGALEIGMVNSQETWLGTGLAAAVNRLRTSQAKSKVIVLLTDGEPSPGEKVAPDAAIGLARHFGIKVYTIGVGNVAGGFINHPLFGVQRVSNTLNVPLLKNIATQTGGLFLQANNPKEMRQAYDTIDKLEKTSYQTKHFHHYYEAFLVYIWFVLGLLVLELLLRLFIWRGV